MSGIKRTFGFLLNHPLGKKHPVKVLSRFVYWQLQYRLSSSKFIIKTFISPVKFYAAKGLTGITGNIYTGLHEFNDMCFLLHFLTPDDVFFDVGANVGSYTLLASGVRKAKTVAIEPVKSTFDILSDNINLNKLQGVTLLINAAVGATEGELKFSTKEDTTNHVISVTEMGNNNSITVTVITIDSLLNTNMPVLKKIDVEGFETEVLKGMANILNSAPLKAIIIELNGSGERYGFNEKKIHDLLLSKNFNPFNYDPFKRTLTPLSTYSNFNTIYCRDIDFINARLKSAKRVKIMGEVI
jgi:FkbM family methyltransferase